MADQITNYKCPACSGPLHFAAKSGKMECEFCGSSYSVEEIEATYAEADAKAAQAKAEADNKPASDNEWEVSEERWNGEGMKSYSCPSCGATLVCDDTFAASSCPYCGNPTVVPGQFTDMLKPDFVLPFKLEKDDALEALKKHYGKKYLLPQAFKNANHLDEVKGVYVPFWLYDGKAYGDCVYEAVKSQTKRQGDEEITTKEIYQVERKGTLEFSKIPADASTKMDDNLMESIEPYKYEDLKPFSKAYLTGYMADKYDVEAKDDAPRAIKRARESTKNALYTDVKGYTSVNTKTENIKVDQGKAYYAMLPVWLLTTRWNGNNYTFAMNGQTGKLVGDLPTNKPKMWLTIAAVFAAVMLATMLLADWAVGGCLVAAIVTAGIVGIILYNSTKSVAHVTAANNYITEDGVNITHRKDTFLRKEESRQKIKTGN